MVVPYPKIKLIKIGCKLGDKELLKKFLIGTNDFEILFIVILNAFAPKNHTVYFV